MKKLIFIRHAKSDWGNESLKDIDRPLNERGYGDAYLQSEWFFSNHDVPQLFVSSDATRALSTCLIFARNLNHPTAEIKIVPQVYEASAQDLKSVIAAFSNDFSYVVVFGHNPGFTNTVNELTDDLFFENIPTCGIVALEFNIHSWKDVVSSKGKVSFHRFPKEFK
jgi:phosphohistidine phosphatase